MKGVTEVTFDVRHCQPCEGQGTGHSIQKEAQLQSPEARRCLVCLRVTQAHVAKAEWKRARSRDEVPAEQASAQAGDPGGPRSSTCYILGARGHRAALQEGSGGTSVCGVDSSCC